MKLTKTILIKTIKPGMENLGFHWFKDSISGAQGLFSKKIDDALYLTVGMTIHRYYDDAFTADWYLSSTTTIYCTWGDIPNDCRKRPEDLLQEKDGVLNYKDGWWSCGNSLQDFFLALRLSEPRMYGDEDLIRRIHNSKEITYMRNISRKIIKRIGNLPDITYSFVPAKEIDDIPLDWFKAAEWTLCEMGKSINSRVVKFYASDAFRQYILDKKYGKGFL